MYDRLVSWFGIDTLIKSGGVKLVVWVQTSLLVNKGNNKISEHRAILQRERQNS